MQKTNNLNKQIIYKIKKKNMKKKKKDEIEIERRQKNKTKFEIVLTLHELKLSIKYLQKLQIYLTKKNKRIYESFT